MFGVKRFVRVSGGCGRAPRSDPPGVEREPPGGATGHLGDGPVRLSGDLAQRPREPGRAGFDDDAGAAQDVTALGESAAMTRAPAASASASTSP